jgi:membrane fusion protein (multidrug efflux system)
MAPSGAEDRPFTVNDSTTIPSGPVPSRQRPHHREPFGVQSRISSVVVESDYRALPIIFAMLDFVDVNNAARTALKGRLESDVPLVLTFRLNRPLEPASHLRYRVIEALTAESVLQHLGEHPVAALVLGASVASEDAARLIIQIFADSPERSTLCIVLGADPRTDVFQELVADDRIFYLARGELSSGQMCSIVDAAVNRYTQHVRPYHELLAAAIAAQDRLADFFDKLTLQADIASVGALLVDTVRTLIGADRVQCLIYDFDNEVLRSTNSADRERTESAAAGLTAFVARTGSRVQVDRAEEDPRYDAEADDPGGPGDARLIVEPVFPGMAGADRETTPVLAVVTAARDGNRLPFSSQEQELLALMATCVSPTLSQMALQKCISGTLSGGAQSMLGGAEVFRREALEHKAGRRELEGDLLKTSPRWLRRLHWAMVAMLVATLGYLVVGRVHEYASGPAVIRARAKVDVAVLNAGVIRSVDVVLGQRVALGDVLVQLEDEAGTTPAEPSRLTVRAPIKGVVSRIQGRQGQRVTAGDELVRIIDDGAGYELIAFLPGSYAPQLHAGLNISVTVEGYPDSNEVVTMDEVGPEIVGPREAARYAGRDNNDVLAVPGPVVIVRSPLQSARFQSNGQHYAFLDGMTGRAEISLRSEPIIISLVPGLRGMFR